MTAEERTMDMVRPFVQNCKQQSYKDSHYSREKVEDD